MRVHKAHHIQAHTLNSNFALRAGWHSDVGRTLGLSEFQFTFPLAAYSWGAAIQYALSGSQQVDMSTHLNGVSM